MSKSRRLLWIVTAVFALALVMGSGPGIHLVNRPETVPIGFGLRLPLLYAWAILWYGVEAACVIAAYVFLWRGSDDEA